MKNSFKRMEGEVTRRIVAYRFTGHAKRKSDFPEIRLRGRWLKQLGFQSGHIITITCRDRELLVSTDGTYPYPSAAMPSPIMLLLRTACSAARGTQHLFRWLVGALSIRLRRS